MRDDPWQVVTYTAASIAAACTLVYVFGPSIFPSGDSSSQQQQREGVVGLRNAANDCFINSVVQALAGSNVLRHYLSELFDDHQTKALQSATKEIDNGGNETPNDESTFKDPLRHALVSKALLGFMIQLTSDSPAQKTISPTPFIRALELAFGSRLSRQQQDAQELLQLLLARLLDEAQAVQRQDKPALSFEGHLESVIECQTCHFKPQPRRSSFLILTLNVVQQTNTSLDDCLDGLFKEESIDDYICHRCRLDHALNAKIKASKTNPYSENLQNEINLLSRTLQDDPENVPNGVDLPDTKFAPRRSITKFNRVCDYPEICAVHLSRSVFGTGSYSSKNTAKVSFPEFLSLGFLDKKLYRLASIITHRGGHNSGHYETFRRQSAKQSSHGADQIDSIDSAPNREAGVKLSSANQQQRKKKGSQRKWWCISDDKIGGCNTVDVLAKQAEVYILLYERTHS